MIKYCILILISHHNSSAVNVTIGCLIISLFDDGDSDDDVTLKGCY